MTTNLKEKTISNLFWRFAERTGAQSVTLIVTIILARLLDPEVYGTIALVTVFTTIIQVFVDSGMANALIQKKDADALDFSSVFYFNIVFALGLYVVLWFISPLIAAFYENSELITILRVLGITVVISGVRNIQQAYVSKNLLFKKFFYSTLGGTMGAAVVGITMALCGFGVWALVFQQIVNALLDTIILWITVKWRPRLEFSISRLAGLISYGWKLLVSSLIDTIYNNLQQLIIGKWYTASDLGYYNQGNKFPNIIVTNINSSIDSVLLPVIAKEQDDHLVVKQMTRRAIKTSSYIMMPLMIGLFCVAEPLVKLLLTDKWIPCVPYLRVFCLTYALYPIHTANLSAIKALGRSDIYLILEVIKKIVGLVVLLISMTIDPFAIAVGLLITSVLATVINSFPNKRLMEYGYLEQIKDIFPNILLAVIMGCIIFPISYIPVNVIIIVIIQILLGVISYIILSFITHNENFKYIIISGKEMIRKNKD